MTKVYVEHPWRKSTREMELHDALTPDTSDSDDSIDRAARNAQIGLEALGKLSALLVEKGVITLDEASDAMGVFPYPTFKKPAGFEE